MSEGNGPPTARFSVDITKTHIPTIYVVAIIATIVGAAVGIVRSYTDLKWKVQLVQDRQSESVTKRDLQTFQVELTSGLEHHAAERVRFYVDHAALECDTTKTGKRRAACRLIWPIPDGRKNDE